MADAIRYNGFPKGVDNRRDDYDVPRGAMRNGVNIDILASGRVRRRAGITQAISDPDAHSIFSDGVHMVWATSTALKVVGPDLVPTTVLTSSLLATPLCYEVLHGEIYFSNEYINGRITAAGAYEPWGIEPPSAAPTLSTTAGDRLVMVTCAFVIGRTDDPTRPGEESGAPLGAAIACRDEPAILLTNIPQSTDARVRWTRIYVTAVNGTEFYAEVDVPAGVTSTTIQGHFGAGQILQTQFMRPPPCGQQITYCNGCFYIAAGSNVFATEPLRYGLHNPESGFLMYPERVTLLKGMDDGMYLSAERTWFLAGVGTPEVKPIQVFPYRAIEGAVCTLPDTDEAVWVSERGVIRARNGGSAKNLTESQVAMETVSRACIGVLERKGHKAFIVVAEEGRANPLVSDDFTAAEAARLADLE